MRTLEQFQTEVLAQLRKERDEKFAATYDNEAKVEAEAENARNQLANEKRDFLHKQAVERHAFEEEQAAKRQQIHIAYYSGRASIKRLRRAINEEYADQFSRVFQQYNQERMEAGESPIVYQKDGKAIEVKEHENRQKSAEENNNESHAV